MVGGSYGQRNVEACRWCTQTACSGGGNRLHNSSMRCTASSYGAIIVSARPDKSSIFCILYPAVNKPKHKHKFRDRIVRMTERGSQDGNLNAMEVCL